MAATIPFNRASAVGRERENISAVIGSGRIGGDGAYAQACQQLLENSLGVGRALLTGSGTHALEMAALLLELEPGSEVIVPSFSHVSTANAFASRGARPAFGDVRPDTLNLDEKRLAEHLTERTRAIVVTHYSVGCEMEAILALGQRHDVAIVEDNALGLFGQYKGRHLGSFGALASQSFHETKNVSCGEGGALLVNDRRLVVRAEIIRAMGTNRVEFERGEVEAYSWVDQGSSYLLAEILAAYLLAQLEARPQIQARRKAIWETYYERLADWVGERGIALATVPPYCEQSYHLFYLLMPSPAQRRAMQAHLASSGIQSAFHYQPLHLSAMGRRFGGRQGDCPVAEDVAGRLLRLPLYYDLSEAELAAVIDAVQQFEFKPD